MAKFVIACIDNNIEVLDKLYSKIARIVDSDYIIESYINAQQALIGCYNHIINGNEVLITIINKNKSDISVKEFILELYKNSNNTKNIIFENSCTLNELHDIINNASVYKIIPNEIETINFELIVLEAIKINANERRLLEYQRVLESAVDRRTKELNNINVKLQILATTDALTGIKNRRSFMESCDSLIKYTKREAKSLAFLMIDIDRFKNINDMYGHAIGDKAIKLLASKISENLRQSDVFARIGGEEFAIALPNTSKRGALKVAKNLKDEVQHAYLKTDDGKVVKYTISIGVAFLKFNDFCTKDVLSRADIALYEAKNSGRNRVCIYKEE